MKKLIPFDIERAKAGDKVITRNGAPVEILSLAGRDKWPIVGYDPEYEYDSPELCEWKIDGRFFEEGDDSSYDLFMTPKEQNTKGGWVNIYRFADDEKLRHCCAIHASKKDAENAYNFPVKDMSYITTIYIQWEE